MTPRPEKLYVMGIGWLLPDRLPIPCYLVQTSDGRNILIDSGMPDPDQIPGGPNIELATDVIQQLATLGIQPGDIDTLICSHFDIDHAGHNADFPNAELIVQRTHYDYAFTSERVAAVRSQWDLPQARYRFIDGDLELLPGLRLIATSGHLPGHQSVLVTLPKTGGVLLTIDAAFNQTDFVIKDLSDDLPTAQRMGRASIHKLIALARQEDARLVIFGHDAGQWSSLRKLPAYYD